jgi:hypothetical protein
MSKQHATKKKNKVGCIIDAYSYLITKPGSYFLSSGRLNEVAMSQKKLVGDTVTLTTQCNHQPTAVNINER